MAYLEELEHKRCKICGAIAVVCVYSATHYFKGYYCRTHGREEVIRLGEIEIREVMSNG